MKSNAEIFVRPVDPERPHGRVVAVDARWDDEGYDRHEYWRGEFESLGDLCRRLGVDVPAAMWQQEIAGVGEECLSFEGGEWSAAMWPEGVDNGVDR